ncbi:MAG: tetratricopeptide repeat protein [Sulfurihydrogenibium sp.]
MKKIFVWLLILFINLNSYGKSQDKDYEIYKKALSYYNYGSYYSALDELEKILPKRNLNFYPDILLLTAKTYLGIGIKSGINKYLWNAVYYLNYYVAANGKLNEDYYYTKGLAYERLGFYERALTNYKIALLSKSDNSNLYNKIILGILRTSILLGKVDNITKYIVYLAPLETKEGEELSLILGMKYFFEGNYKLAFDYFSQVYQDFEEYLLYNPEFYYYIGETAYRLKNYSFAKRIFRKIVSNVKNDEVIRKAYLRLGDIALIENDKYEAFNNYYIVINRFPETNENTVARLKMLALGLKYPDLQPRIKKIKQLEDPIKFVVKTLISNRTNYIGKYAIGNFGVLVLQNPTDYLINKLSYELSLLYPASFTYEQAEYIRWLWSPYLKKLDKSALVKLYKANPKFFKDIFDEDILKIIVDNLDDNYYKKDLLKFLVQKYSKDEYKIQLAKIYYQEKKYSKGLDLLSTVNDKNCDYYILSAVLKQAMSIDFKKDLESISTTCKDKESKLPFEIGFDYYLLKGQYDEIVSLIQQNKDKLPNDDAFKQKLSNFLIELYKKGKYEDMVKILDSISENYIPKEKMCDISSYYLIVKTKLNSLDAKDVYYNNIEKCENELAKVALELYKTLKVIKEVNKNVR